MSSTLSNKTNVTTTYSSVLNPIGHDVLAINIIFQFDAVLRFYSFFVHIFYFFLVCKIPELQRISLLYVHHTNVISFLFNLHYIVYYDYLHPNFADQNLNNIICTISEVAWAMLKLLRTYSIAQIALYRLIAVFKVNIYRKMNKSKLSLVFPLIGVYLLCAIIFLATKYGFHTTYGQLYCFDGFSPVVADSIGYFAVNAVLGFIIPVVFAVLAYELIKRKLAKLSAKTEKKKTVSTFQKSVILKGGPSKSIGSDHVNSIEAPSAGASTMIGRKSIPGESGASGSPANVKHDYERQSSLAKQFFIMDLCEIASSIMVVGLGMRYMMPDLNNYYNIPRFLMRSFNLLFQSFVPVAAMVYNPDICKQLRKWRKKYLKCLSA